MAATEDEMSRPLEILDPLGWLGGEVADQRILCLGAGGGRHGPMLANAGARVTVVDISPEMLRLDEELAEARGLQVETVATSIDDLSMLPAAEYDAVMQPVRESSRASGAGRSVGEVAEAGGIETSRWQRRE